MTLRTDRDQVWNANGDLLSDVEVERDDGGIAVRSTLEQRVRDALVANVTYLAVAAPTAAQNTAQIKSLTRQVNALIRLQLRALDVAD